MLKSAAEVEDAALGNCENRLHLRASGGDGAWSISGLPVHLHFGSFVMLGNILHVYGHLKPRRNRSYHL